MYEQTSRVADIGYLYGKLRPAITEEEARQGKLGFTEERWERLSVREGGATHLPLKLEHGRAVGWLINTTVDQNHVLCIHCMVNLKSPDGMAVWEGIGRGEWPAFSIGFDSVAGRFFSEDDKTYINRNIEVSLTKDPREQGTSWQVRCSLTNPDHNEPEFMATPAPAAAAASVAVPEPAVAAPPASTSPAPPQADETPNYARMRGMDNAALIKAAADSAARAAALEAQNRQLTADQERLAARERNDAELAEIKARKATKAAARAAALQAELEAKVNNISDESLIAAGEGAAEATLLKGSLIALAQDATTAPLVDTVARITSNSVALQQELSTAVGVIDHMQAEIDRLTAAAAQASGTPAAPRPRQAPQQRAAAEAAKKIGVSSLNPDAIAKIQAAREAYANRPAAAASANAAYEAAQAKAHEPPQVPAHIQQQQVPFDSEESVHPDVLRLEALMKEAVKNPLDVPTQNNTFASLVEMYTNGLNSFLPSPVTTRCSRTNMTPTEVLEQLRGTHAGASLPDPKLFNGNMENYFLKMRGPSRAALEANPQLLASAGVRCFQAEFKDPRPENIEYERMLRGAMHTTGVSGLFKDSSVRYF